MKLFRDLLVVERAGSAAGAYAAKLFADHGASVVKIEPPGGDPLRRAGPMWRSDAGDVGALFAYLNTSKRSRVLDLESAAGRRELAALLESADVWIESSAPDPLEPLPLDAGCAQLVRVRISAFASAGPYARFRSNAFTDDAISGHLYLNGEPDREPITRPGRQSEYQAGVHGFIGALAALRARESTGRGQGVEVSHFEGLASLHQHTTAMWTHARHVLRREGNTQPGMWHPVGVYRCKDGHVSLALPSRKYRDAFLRAAGLDALLEDPRFRGDLAVAQNKRAFDAALAPWLMQHGAREIIELGQRVPAPVGPAPTPAGVLADEHLAARGHFARLDGTPPLLCPRAPFRIGSREARPGSPPRLGELSAAAAAELAARARSEPARAPRALPAGPLDGLRVLDLTRVWAGPLAARMLGDLGADVLCIEAPFARGIRSVPAQAARVTHMYADNDVGERPWNRGGAFNELHRNKRSVTLDLKEPRALALFESLVRCADVVLENYSPRVMPGLGLGFERLRELNPHVVYASIPGYGRSGPRRDWVAFGPLIEAGAGLSSLMGYADSGPYRSGIAWPDPVAGIHAVAAVLLALHDRDADPERAARSAEVPMLEAMTMFLGEELLAAQLREGEPLRRGNRSEQHAPQGVYRCAGDDCWIALTVESDLQWRALCEIAALDARFFHMDLEARHKQHDAIDRALAGFTASRAADALMQELQERGVIACRVSDAPALVDDPQLLAQRFWAELDHPDAGRHRAPGIAIRLEHTPATFRRPAPLLGQHNREVLRELLALSDAELDSLERAGLLVDRPPEEPQRS